MPFALVIAAVLSADPAELTLDAERVVHDGQKELTNAEGHAALRTAGAAMDADRIVYDKGRQAATATDQVVLRLIKGGPIVVIADVVTVRFDGDEVSEVYFFEGEAYGKSPDTSADALLSARTPAAAKALGRNTLRLEGNHLVRKGNVWQAEGLDLVPCDCDLTHPSWKIHTTQAYIDGDAKRVSVVAPSVWIHGVPVLWLPWLYLPLSNRATGLLMPRPLIGKQNGFGLEWPLFVTLGRSADLTLTPGFFTGGKDAFGVAGPRLNTELRYVPSTRASGRVTLGLIYDLRAPRDPVTAAMAPAPWSPLGWYEQPGARGLRGEASWQHSQDFGGGVGARVDASVHSDGFYQRDVVTDVIARENGYLRSAATLFQRGADHVVGLDVVLRQDIAWGYGLFDTPRLRGSTSPLYGPNTFQRWPALQLAVPLKPLVGPLAFSLEAGAVRLAPLWGQTGDEGVSAREGRADGVSVECLQQRLFFPSLGSLTPAACGLTAADKLGQGDRVWQKGERTARDRLDVMPRLVVGGAAFDALALSAFAGWRQNAWVDEVTGKTSFRGYPLLGGRAETELARAFDGGLRHALVPAVEVRAVPLVTGAPPAPYDEIDGAVPSALGLKQGVVQANVELGQRLQRRNAPDVARLDLGQGFELWGPYGAGGAPGPRLGESWARLAAGWGLFRASATGRLDTRTGIPTRISASAALDGGPARGLYANYEYVLDDGNLRSRAPIDLLFGAPLATAATGPQGPSFTHLLSAGGRYKLWELTFRYDALFSNPGWQGTPAAPTRTFTLVQHTLGIGWTPNCDCWRVEAWVTHRLDVGASLATGKGVWTSAWPIDVGATFTVTQFGSFGR